MSSRPADGAWSTPQKISSITGFLPRIVVDDLNRATATWYTSWAIQASSQAEDGSWSAPTDVSDTATMQGMSLAVDGAGKATVTWSQVSLARSINSVASASRPRDGVWSAPTILDSGQGQVETVVVAAPDGTVTALWKRDASMVTRTRPSGSDVWNSVVTISPLSGANPALAVNASGDVIAAWNQAHRDLYASVRPAGGSFAAPGLIAQGPPINVASAVALDKQGNAAAIWFSGDNTIRASHLPKGGQWATPTTVSGPQATGPMDAYVAVAMDHQGNATGVWGRNNGINTVIESGVLDNDDPVITGFTAASSGETGHPLPFSASGTDTWPWVEYVWDFGDGSEEVVSPNPTHAFTTPGTYTVTMSAKDWAGNTTTRTTTVEIILDVTPSHSEIETGPVGEIKDDSPTFEFASNEPAATFECRLIGPGIPTANWSVCASPLKLEGLKDGAYTLEIRAIDATRNVEASPITKSFTVDVTAPRTTVSPTTGTDATRTFTFTADDPDATFECRVDGPGTTVGVWAECTSPRPCPGWPTATTPSLCAALTR